MGRLFDSKQFRTDLQLSGSFSGSFIGDGSSLTNVPATGIVGLNLSQIGSGSATASISPDNGLHVNTSISASIISGSILVTAPTGSFSHIITDDDTIEFRNKSTGVQTGRLKFDSENGLNVQDSAGGRTRIKAGFGKFLQLESFSSFNSIGPLTASIISASSTIFANDIEAFRMNVTHLTSSFITASTIETSGSNIFGDESSDTHTFVGDIIAQNNISSSGYISASNFIGDGSSLTGVDSIYTANGNILETRTINDRDGGFTGTAGSNALKMNVRNSGALLVAGYQNNGDPGTTNHLIQWGPGTTAGGMNVRGKLGLTSGGGRIDLTNSGGSQYFTVAQSGITSLVSLSATNITGSNISASGIFTGDGSGLINIPASGITGLNLSQIASGSVTASIAPDKGFQVNTNTNISGSLTVSGSSHLISGSTTIYSTGTPGLTIQSNNDPAEETKIYDAKIALEDSGLEQVVIKSNTATNTMTGNISLRAATLAYGYLQATSYHSNNRISWLASGIRLGERLSDPDSSPNQTSPYVLSATGSVGFEGNTDITGSLSVSGSGITIDSGSLNLNDNDSTQLNIPADPGVYEASYHGLTAGGSGNTVSFSANNVGSMAVLKTSGRLGVLELNNWTSGIHGIYLNGYKTTSPLNSTYQRNFIGNGLVVNRAHSATTAATKYALDVSGPTMITGSNSNALFGLHVSSSGGSGSMKLEGNAQITGSLTVTGNVSSSAASTASFGTYLGDGSQLTGVEAFPFSGDAVITGSLTVSGSAIDFSNATSVTLPAATVPLINPKVEYVNTAAITSSGTTVPLPNGLTFISSSAFEYIEIFINGLRMRYDVDFMPPTTASIKYFVTIPSGSEITYKSLNRP